MNEWKEFQLSLVNLINCKLNPGLNLAKKGDTLQGRLTMN